MSRYDYEISKQITLQDYPFYALIMAAMRQADTSNSYLLRQIFPGVADELYDRYQAPGGRLAEDPPYYGPNSTQLDDPAMAALYRQVEAHPDVPPF